MRKLSTAFYTLLSWSGRANAIVCALGLCPTITETKPGPTVTEIKTEQVTVTSTVPASVPTPYAVLEVFTKKDCPFNELTFLPDGQMQLSAGKCEDIDSAYDNPESLESERLTRVFDQPACQACTLTVYTERACGGQSRQVPLEEPCARTDCKDGSLDSWAGSGGDDQALSYKLDCA